MTAITGKRIDAALKTFTTNVGKLRGEAATIAMMVLNHAAPEAAGPDAVGSGDCTRMLKLAKLMPTSWQEQLQAWCKAFTPIVLIVARDKCEYDPKYKALGNDAEAKLAYWKLSDAAETPFHEFAKERTASEKPFDFDVLLAQFIKRGEKQLEEGKVLPEKVEYIKAGLRTLAALKVVVPAPANDVKEAIAA